MQRAMPHDRCQGYFTRLRAHPWSGISHTRGVPGGKRKIGVMGNSNKGKDIHRWIKACALKRPRNPICF